MSSVVFEHHFQGETGRDEFQREPVAAKVISLLVSDAQVSPMVIDGDWGTGKTEFCHKLINKFKAEHGSYRIVYVDAFKADHADNPLMTILAEVLKLLPEGDQRKGFIQKALPVIRYGLKTALKVGVGHVLRKNADDIADELEEALEETTEKVIDASVEALLKEHEKAEQSLAALQKSLAHIASESPIVMFIDELDRCRPDFSVEMLEVIKHTFDVEGVKFVLVTNTKQLTAAINHRYGSEVDSQRYLNKFLKFRFSLPDTLTQSKHDRTLAAVAHFQYLVSQSQILNSTNLASNENRVKKFVEVLIGINSLSLREVETFVRYLEIYQTLTANQGLASNLIFAFQLLRVFGVYLFCFKSKIADNITRKLVSADEILNVLAVTDLPKINLKEYKYPEDHEVVAIMLAKDCHLGNERFVNLNDEWNTIFIEMFERRYYGSSSPINIIVETIDVLSFKF
jgi:KAP family P-loop domain.